MQIWTDKIWTVVHQHIKNLIWRYVNSYIPKVTSICMPYCKLTFLHVSYYCMKSISVSLIKYVTELKTLLRTTLIHTRYILYIYIYLEFCWSKTWYVLTYSRLKNKCSMSIYIFSLLQISFLLVFPSLFFVVIRRIYKT